MEFTLGADNYAGTISIDLDPPNTDNMLNVLTDIVNKITDITVKSIEETSLLADEKVLYEVAKGIMKADVIDFYGVGASNNIAFDAAFKSNLPKFDALCPAFCFIF